METIGNDGGVIIEKELIDLCYILKAKPRISEIPELWKKSTGTDPPWGQPGSRFETLTQFMFHYKDYIHNGGPHVEWKGPDLRNCSEATRPRDDCVEALSPERYDELMRKIQIRKAHCPGTPGSMFCENCENLLLHGIVLMSCGHTFCSNCYSGSCSVCMNDESRIDEKCCLELRKLVLSVYTRCPYLHSARCRCFWKGPIVRLPNHIHVCQYAPDSRVLDITVVSARTLNSSKAVATNEELEGERKWIKIDKSLTLTNQSISQKFEENLIEILRQKGFDYKPSTKLELLSPSMTTSSPEKGLKRKTTTRSLESGELSSGQDDDYYTNCDNDTKPHQTVIQVPSSSNSNSEQSWSSMESEDYETAACYSSLPPPSIQNRKMKRRSSLLVADSKRQREIVLETFEVIIGFAPKRYGLEREQGLVRVRVGSFVTLYRNPHNSINAWIFVQNSQGESGWIPCACLKKYSETRKAFLSRMSAFI